MKFINLGPSAIFTVCMLAFSILILFDLTLTNAGRTRLFYILSQCKTCEMGSELAKSDFDKGAYFLIRWGLPEAESIVVGEVLQTDYRIDQIYGGCAPRYEVDCYTNTMYALLQQKYGEGFYLQVRNKAHRLYNETKNTNSPWSGSGDG